MDVQQGGIYAFHEVLGVDVDETCCFWTLHSDREFVQQAAYRVTLSLMPHGEELLWETGKVESNERWNIVCKPDGCFKSATFHHLPVTVWDKDVRATTSRPNEFFAAYLQSSRILPPYSMSQTYSG